MMNVFIERDSFEDRIREALRALGSGDKGGWVPVADLINALIGDEFEWHLRLCLIAAIQELIDSCELSRRHTLCGEEVRSSDL